MSDLMQVELRNLQMEDFRGLVRTMKKAYPNWEDSFWRESQVKKLLEIFPEGQLCVLVNGKVAGAALSLMVDYDLFGDNHTYAQITGNETFSTHTEDGDVLYGIDLFIHPEFRSLRLGRRLYDARKELCEHHNLKAIVAGGRIPNYKEHAKEMTVRQYIAKVRHKEIHDPVLSFQLANDFHIIKVIKGYLPGDKDSLEYAVLIEWNNVYYEKEEMPVSITKSVVRLGLVQWQMRNFGSMEALCEQLEFFVDAVSGYQADFALFPEFVEAPLMAEFNEMSEAEAIRNLAIYTEPLLDKFREYAVAYNVNIITGSMPYVEEDGRLLNVGYLCRRDGSYERYEKLHITPSEAQAWGMVGGHKLKTFDTDCGRIGILVCYDVEFPELPRLLAQDGMQMLFVPFLTDTQNGYTRVRNCAMARAIENECYVAIAGAVGNLPKVNNMDIQFAQSAVFTPSDFAFPTNGIKAEATPNTEMTLIVDVDLGLLKDLHHYGSVRNLRDRRQDIYDLKLKPVRSTNQKPRVPIALVTETPGDSG
ncbi:MAG: carbon-nitrogen hydrolase family protein [Bacteroidota bacterium]